MDVGDLPLGGAKLSYASKNRDAKRSLVKLVQGKSPVDYNSISGGVRTGAGLTVHDLPPRDFDARGLQSDGPVLVLAGGLGCGDERVHGVGEIAEDELLVVHAHSEHAVEEGGHRLDHAGAGHHPVARMPVHMAQNSD